jgi:putative ABC transport system substrate-binding protein
MPRSAAASPVTPPGIDSSRWLPRPVPPRLGQPGASLDRRRFLGTLAGGLLATPLAVEAQQSGKIYHVGVVLQGGPYYAAIDGLRDGLKETGFDERTQYQLHIRDMKGSLGAIAGAAQDLEREKVDLIYAIATSVAKAMQGATTKVPIVFYAGSDPVDNGLVSSFAKPGGRLTGVHSRNTVLTSKRLEILKEILARNSFRALTYYDSTNPIARGYAREAREAALQLRIELLERYVRSVDELRDALQRLKPGEVDALFVPLDSIVTSQAAFIADTAKTKRLPTMFYERTSVAAGGLASYGTSYYAVGRLAAKYVRQVLLGARPADLPVERSERFELVINLTTAKALGLTIPPSLLQRADQVLE